MKMTVIVAAVLAGSFAFGETLTWNGSDGQGWDDSTANWKNALQESVTWTPGAVAEFANDALKEVSLLKGQAVSGLLFSGTDAATTLSGNPLTFVSPDGTTPATIHMSSALAKGVISSDVSDCGVVTTFDTEDQCLSGERVRASSYYLAPMNSSTQAGTNVLYWTNRDLSKLVAFRATILHHDGTSGREDWDETPARQTSFVRGTDGGADTVSVTFNCRQPATDEAQTNGKVWCFGVVFTQVGPDIAARVSFVRTVSDYKDGVRQNYDDGHVCSNTYGDMTPKEVWTQLSDRINGGTTTCGSVGNILAAEASAVTGGEKGLAFQEDGVTTCTNAVYGSGLKVSDGRIATRDPVLCFKNVRLADVDAFFCDFHLLANAPYKARGYNLTWNGNKLSVSFQQYLGVDLWNDIGSAFTGVVNVDFWQEGNDIYAKWVGSGNRGLGWKFAHHSSGVIPCNSYASGNNNYGVSNIRLRMKPATVLAGDVALTGGLTMAGGSLGIGSASLAELRPTGSGDLFFSPASDDLSAWQSVGIRGYADTKGGLRLQGSYVFDGRTDATFLSTKDADSKDERIVAAGASYVDVRNGARLKLDCPTSGESKYYVGANSLLYTKADSGRLKYNDWVDVDGGTLAINHQFTYIGPVTLRNRGRLTSHNGSYFRIGHEPSFPLMFSCGEGTNIVDTGMYLYRRTYNDGTWQEGTSISFVTDADLLINNCVRNTNVTKDGVPVLSYTPSLVRKLGPAKMILGPNCYNPEGVNQNTVTVEVVHGTLRVESPRAIRVVNGTLFHAGTTLDLADNVTMTTGVFTVDVTKYDDATERATYKTVNVALGSGSGLVVPQAANFFVTNGCTLVFNDKLDTDGRRVRIGDGSLANRLSAVQLSRIRHAAGSGIPRRVCQDNDGYLVPSGFLILLR